MQMPVVDVRIVRVSVNTGLMDVFMSVPAFDRRIVNMLMMQIIMQVCMIVCQNFMLVSVTVFFPDSKPDPPSHKN